MKESRFLILLFFLIHPALYSQSIEVPFLTGRVNDTAGMLSYQTIYELEDLLKAHEDSTSNQVAVLTIPFLGGADLEEYSMKVAETWKLGQAEKDNGVLLLIVRDDRLVRIEVGSGLEGDLPDITCGHIIRYEIVPRFKDGDYNGGVRAGVESILAAIAGAYFADASEESEPEPPNLLFGMVFFLFFLLVVGTFTLAAVFSTGVSGWFLYLFLVPFWIAFPMASFGKQIGGVLFGLYALGAGAAKIWLATSEKGKAFMKKWGKKFPASRGGSSGSRSWGSSSGGSSGGGFSGGGGGFSGGGASGSW